MLRLNIQHKVSRLFTMFVFICIFVLVVSYQPLTLSKAESDYQEELYMYMDMNGDFPIQGSANIDIYLRGIKGLSNYTSVFMNENFKTIGIIGEFRWYGNKLHIDIVFDPSQIRSIEEGKINAEKIIRKIENVWGIKFSYERHIVGTSTVENKTVTEIFYTYDANEEPSLQEMREVLLQYCPSEGFGKIPRLMNFWDDVDIYLNIRLDEQHNPVWDMTILARYTNYFGFSTDQKYTLGLENLTSYAEPIQSLPEASRSYISLQLSKTGGQFRFTNVQASPEQMKINVGMGYDSFSFSLDMKGEKVDNLSVSFILVPFDVNRDPYMFLGLLGAFVAILIYGSILFVRMKTKPKRAYYKL